MTDGDVRTPPRRRLTLLLGVASIVLLSWSQVASATVVGRGDPASCTSAAVVHAVARGGHVTFACGSRPLTILLKRTAMVPKTVRKVVIDGGNRVTLSGEGRRRILFSDTCQGTWSTDDCINQPFPDIVVENLRLTDGSSLARQNIACHANTPACWYGGVDGGGAIYAEGGRLSILHDTFSANRCAAVGPDLGGGAIRALAQYENEAVRAVDSTFTDNRCSNGGAISSIDTAWDITGCSFTHNAAIGWGANPAKPGTSGGGSGGAAYFDGKDDDVGITSTRLSDNSAREGGGAIFDVVDFGYGALTLTRTHLSANPSGVFQTAPGIYYLLDGLHAAPKLIDSSD